MTTQTELEKRLQELESNRNALERRMKNHNPTIMPAYYEVRKFDEIHASDYHQLALSAIKLAAARQELIEWLESDATSGDAEIRRRIEEASR